MANLRALIFAGVMVLVFVLDIVGTATPLATSSKDDFKVTVSMWKSCASAPGIDESCKDNMDDAWKYDPAQPSVLAYQDCDLSKFKALRALAVMSILISIGGIVVGALDFIGKIPNKLVLVVVTAVLCLWELCVWATWAHYFNAGCDDRKTFDNAFGVTDWKWGASPVMFILTWLLNGALIPVALLFKGKDADPATQSIM